MSTQVKKICPKVLSGDCPFGDERGACYHAKLHIDAGEQCDDCGISEDPNDSRQCGSCISYAKLSKNDKLKVMLMEL